MDKYIELLKKNNYEELANISFIDDLVKYKYQDKYLIEYLLKNNFHSDKMDKYLKFHENFIPFYLKYNIIKPLLNCSLNILLKKDNGELYFDLILDKLTDEDKIKLYYNLRKESYNDFQQLEREVIDIYLRQGIILPVVFVSTKLNKIDDVLIDSEIINEFKELFKDTDIKLLNFLENEFKRCLIKDRKRTISDLKKIIEFKRKKTNFSFIVTRTLNGSYSHKKLEIETNANDPLMFNHELSHFLFQEIEDNNIVEEYEKIRKNIDTRDNYLRTKLFLMELHKKYDKLKQEIEEKYDKKIIEFYGSLDNYLKKIGIDMKNSNIEFLLVRNKETSRMRGVVIMDTNLDDIALSFIETEKFEYSIRECRRNFSAFLMLENMLDAIFKGKIFDDTELNCISGHGLFYFCGSDVIGFDECLANYDAICKSDNKNTIIKILKELIGEELIEFLNNYIKKNRVDKNGHR